MEALELQQEVKNIIQSLKKRKKYKVTVYEPNNISEKHHPDGTPFYVIYDLDGVKSSNDFGECCVEVCGHVFTCDLTWGEWSGNFLKQLKENEIEDDSLIEALENAEGVISGENQEMDAQIGVYEAANNCTCEEYYFCEEKDIPIDAEDLIDMKSSFPVYIYNHKKYYIVDLDQIDDTEDRSVHGVSIKDLPDYDGYYDTVKFITKPSKRRKLGFEVVEMQENCNYSFYGVEDTW